MSGIEKFFLNRGDLEKPEYEKTFVQVRQSIQPDLLEFMPYLSFVMLKPDAYLRGLMPEILNRLVSHDIYPISYSLVQLTDDLIDRLYMFVKQRYHDTWWVMKKAYTLAPCLPTLVIGSPDSFPHLSARVRSIIGPTTPTAGHAGQLRYDLRATHRVFNLIHGTDDPASGMRESLIFFGVEEITQALKVASNSWRSETPKPGVQYSNQSLNLTPDAPCDLRFARVMLDAKMQLLLTGRAAEGLSDDRVAACLSRLEALCAQEQDILSKDLTLSEEAKRLHPLMSAERSVLHLLMRDLDSERRAVARGRVSGDSRMQYLAALHKAWECFEILSFFADRVEFSKCNLDAIIAALPTLDVRLSPQDEVVLHTGWAVTPQELWDAELGS